MKDILDAIHGLVPVRWQPTSASFVRFGKSKFAMATNYVFPRSILGYTQQEKDSSAKLRDIFYAMRTSFIGYHCSFIFRTEIEFERLMRKENISRISESDAYIRKKLFNCVLTNNNSPESAEFLVTGRAYNLSSKKWMLPCVKCDYLLRGWSGKRTVRKRFSGRDSQQ